MSLMLTKEVSCSGFGFGLNLSHCENNNHISYISRKFKGARSLVNVSYSDVTNSSVHRCVKTNCVWISAKLTETCVFFVPLRPVFVLFGSLSFIPPRMNALSNQLQNLGPSYFTPTIWVPHPSVLGLPCG